MRVLLPLLTLACFVASDINAQAAIEFDTEGGDAWTFTLPLSGRFDARRCTSVAVESRIARIEALRIDARFHAELPLLPGRNEVRAVCRDANGDAVTSPTQTWHTALADLPKAWIRVRTDAASIHLDSGRTQRAPSLAAPIVRFEWRARDDNPAPLRSSDGKALASTVSIEAQDLQLAIPERDGDYLVTLRATDALGRADESTTVFRVRGKRAETIDLTNEHPGWVDSAVLYGAAPYMFEPQGLRGIERRLDEIAALGATAVWISPVTKAAPDDFGYAVVDQFAIREDFGGAAALRAVVDTAHRLGLRVLVDFVPNHFSQFHAYYADAEQKGRRSPYYDWFDRDAAGKVTQYFDWQHLKNLNFDHAGVRNHIIEAAARFVREFGVDGFRVDASWGVARRAPEFWPQLRAELKRIDPDIVLIAEASAREAYHVANGFDAAYDWTENLGEWAWRDVFKDDGTVDVPHLRAALTNGERGYPPDSLILRFINNNDTGERFFTRFGAETAQLAATLLFTLPGIPLIYNGDEMGAEFQPYDEGPPLRWNETPLTHHYRKLAALRRDSDALRSREMTIVRTNRADSVLAYRRSAPGAADILVLLNFGRAALDVAVDDDAANRLITQRPLFDLLTGKRLATSRARIRIDAGSALLLSNVD